MAHEKSRGHYNENKYRTYSRHNIKYDDRRSSSRYRDRDRDYSSRSRRFSDRYDNRDRKNDDYSYKRDKRDRSSSIDDFKHTDEFGRERRSPSYGYIRVVKSSSISSIEDLDEPAANNNDTTHDSITLKTDISYDINMDNVTDGNSGELDFANFAQLFGFDSFSSSKGHDHLESDASAVNKSAKRKYRQYMNRTGGFNRPLSPK